MQDPSQGKLGSRISSPLQLHTSPDRRRAGERRLGSFCSWLPSRRCRSSVRGRAEGVHGIGLSPRSQGGASLAEFPGPICCDISGPIKMSGPNLDTPAWVVMRRSHRPAHLFVITDLGGRPSMVYLETATEDHDTDSPSVVARVALSFDRLRVEAESWGACRDLIRKWPSNDCRKRHRVATSSHSGSNGGTRVEVGIAGQAVAVRDGNDLDGRCWPSAGTW